MNTITLSNHQIPVIPSEYIVQFGKDGNRIIGRFFDTGKGQTAVLKYDSDKRQSVVSKHDQLNFGEMCEATLEDGTKCFLYSRVKYKAVNYANGRISQMQHSWSILSTESASKYEKHHIGEKYLAESKLMDRCLE